MWRTIRLKMRRPPRQEVHDLHMDDLEAVSNLLLTGKPGSGKTTLIVNAVAGLQGTGGFYTSEVREEGQRVGFSISALDGPVGVLARIDARSPVKVGRYGVDLRDLEEVAAASVERALDDPSTDLVVIDEIGAMEIASARFRSAVSRALDSPKRVLGTIQIRQNQFLDLIRARGDVKVVKVDSSSRIVLPELLRSWLEQRTGDVLVERNDDE